MNEPILRHENSETYCQNSETNCLDQNESSRTDLVCAHCGSVLSENNVLFCCPSCELLFKWSQSEGAKGRPSDIQSDKWSNYSAKDLENFYNFSTTNSKKKFRFYVEGMRCSSCVKTLEEFPNFCKNVYSARVNFSESTLQIESTNKISLGELCQLIEELGFQPTPIKEDNQLEQARVKSKRSDLMRIGVAAAIAGNEMLFLTPIYAGLVGDLGLVFKWISFFLFLPLLFYVATPFYQRAWASLKIRRVNVDMMIVVALWAGFIFSTVSLVQQTDEIYFDSTASFIFLILLTRFLLKSQHDKLGHKNLFEDLFSKDVFEVKHQEKTSYLRFDHIDKDQIFKVKKGQLVPCDSRLLSTTTDFDLSFLTGESYPEVRHQSDTILAGSRLLSAQAEFKCLIKPLESQLATSLRRITEERGEKNKIQNISDLVAHRLTVTVFVIAGLFFIFTVDFLGIEAFKRCLALITIACPCAIAFGTPLAHALGYKKAIKSGFYIKSEDVFDKLMSVKKIIFDKTGTLTSSQMDLVKTTPEEISPFIKSMILGMEKSSMHPVAISLKKNWSAVPSLALNSVREVAGFGVESTHDGRFYEFKKASNSLNESDLKIDFLKDSQRLASVFFKEQVRDEAAEAVDQLKNMGRSVLMLTGDRLARALPVAKAVGIAPENIFAEKSPEQKKDLIRSQNPCLYIGDGLNDLHALSAAHVSFAIKGQFESTLHVSDVYAPQKNLLAINRLFELAQKINQTIKWNLFFALVYNLIGGAFALLGYINPLAAAVLMPISSFIIFTHTSWRLK